MWAVVQPHALQPAASLFVGIKMSLHVGKITMQFCSIKIMHFLPKHQSLGLNGYPSKASDWRLERCMCHPMQHNHWTEFRPHTFPHRCAAWEWIKNWAEGGGEYKTWAVWMLAYCQRSRQTSILSAVDRRHFSQGINLYQALQIVKQFQKLLQVPVTKATY